MHSSRRRVLAQIDAALRDGSKASEGRAAAPVVIPSTEAQNEFGRILDQAAADQDIAITRHNVVRAVLVSAARYRQLTGRKGLSLDQLEAQFNELYASMQTPEARAATTRAINASPEKMGRAAVAVARRARNSRG